MKVSLDQFALEVSDSFGMTKKKAREQVTAIFDILTENVAAGHEVNIPNFGKFRRKDRAARTGRNPATGEDIEIPAKSVPNFLPSKNLKAMCKGG